MEYFLLFSYTGEDLISWIRGSHQQALPLRVFLSLWPGRSGDGQCSLTTTEDTED